MIVVSDTSPIRALDQLNLLPLLEQMYGEVLIPPAVADELGRSTSRLSALEWKGIPGLRLQAPTDILRVRELGQFLDLGESEAIALAIEVHAGALLVDERAARAIADSLGIKVVGVLAMLLEAKAQKRIVAVAPLMDQLRDAINFRISRSLYAQILRRAGE